MGHAGLWALGAVLLLVAGCGLASDGPSADGPGPEPEDLTRILGSERRFEARLSVTPDHVACSTRHDGSAPQRCAPPPLAGSDAHGRVLSLAARAGAVADRGEPGALWVLGLVELLWSAAGGNPPDVAIERLREAALLAPDQVSLQADLAAAHLVRFDMEGSPADLLWAVERSSRALESNPDHLPALFNLALAKERLGLAMGAAETWRRYSEVDRGSAWAGEAEGRAARLAAVRPSRFTGKAVERRGASAGKIEEAAVEDPQGAREYAMDRLLPRWGEAVLSGDGAEAARLLEAAAAVGRALAEMDGDRSVARLVRWAREGEEEEPERIPRLLADYGSALDRYRAGDFGGARAAFQRLEHRATGRDEPLRGWILYYHGATLMNAGRMDAAEPRFQAALRANAPDTFPSLAAKIAWVRGIDEARRGRSVAALPHYAEAARRLEAAGERGQRGAVRYLLALEYLELGERARGLDLLHRGLEDLGRGRGSVQLHNALLDAAELTAEIDLLRAAVVLQQEGIEAAMATGRAVTEAEARIRLARLLVRRGESRRALEELERAMERADDVISESSRAWLRADLLSLVAEAAILAGEESVAHPLLTRAPEELGLRADVNSLDELLIAALDEAARYFESVGRETRLAPVLASRAEAWLRLGRDDRARADLERILDMVAGQREDRDGPARRAALLDGARPAFDAMAALHLNEGRPIEALATLESGRPGLGRKGLDGPEPEDLQELASTIPSERAVVAYGLLGDTLAIWTLRQGSVRVRAVPLGDRNLRTMTEHLRIAAARGASPAALQDNLRTLHRLLIEPVASTIAGAERLVVVPDGPLHAVPFSALRGAEGYLVERVSIRVAPTLEAAAAERPVLSGVLAAGTEAAGAQAVPGTGAGGVLLVAAPSGGPGLPPLPGAAEEVSALQAIHPEARALEVGSDGPSDLVARLADARLFHFAGHAVSNPGRLDRSYLYLGGGDHSAGEGGADRLTAAEIRGLSLEGLALAVLSACRTLTPTGTRSGGFDGVARSFLAAGAGGVLGTLWEVEDRAAREVVVRFHERVRAGAPPAEALRRAQLALLASGDPALASPGAWATFRYTGR